MSIHPTVKVKNLRVANPNYSHRMATFVWWSSAVLILLAHFRIV